MGAARADYTMGIIKISSHSNPQGHFPAKVTAIIYVPFVHNSSAGLERGRQRGRGDSRGDVAKATAP